MNVLISKKLLVFNFLIILFSISCLNQYNKKQRVCFDSGCIEVEIARTEVEYAKGLQSRINLDKDKGMLFVFKKSDRQAFWMKDTLIPLDMMWLDYARRIVYIEHDVQPCVKDPCPSYQTDKDALYVLEVNAGYTSRRNINIGDVVEFKLN